MKKNQKTLDKRLKIVYLCLKLITMKPLTNIILKIFATILIVAALIPVMSIVFLLWDTEFLNLWEKMLYKIWKS